MRTVCVVVVVAHIRTLQLNSLLWNWET